MFWVRTWGNIQNIVFSIDSYNIFFIAETECSECWIVLIVIAINLEEMYPVNLLSKLGEKLFSLFAAMFIEVDNWKLF